MNRLTMRTLVVVLVIAGAAIATGFAVSWHWAVGGDDSLQVAAGRALYSEHCAACHGVRLQGQPDWQNPLPNGRMPAPPHDVSGHTWHHSDRQLLTITKHGMNALVPGYQSDMPAFADLLTNDEIEAILAFIKSTWPRPERDYQAARSKADP